VWLCPPNEKSEACLPSNKSAFKLVTNDTDETVNGDTVVVASVNVFAPLILLEASIVIPEFCISFPVTPENFAIALLVAFAGPVTLVFNSSKETSLDNTSVAFGARSSLAMPIISPH